jgi:hypothetical protein
MLERAVVHVETVGMFLRTTSRKNTDGSTVTYCQLAHIERDPETGVPVARIIHNFGRADQVDREALVRLRRSIARICAVEVRDPLAEHQASLPFTDDVLVPGAVKGLTRPLGVPVVVEHFWDKLHWVRGSGIWRGGRVPGSRSSGPCCSWS